jgi:hypothetical protein
VIETRIEENKRRERVFVMKEGKMKTHKMRGES